MQTNYIIAKIVIVEKLWLCETYDGSRWRGQLC